MKKPQDEKCAHCDDVLKVYIWKIVGKKEEFCCEKCMNSFGLLPLF